MTLEDKVRKNLHRNPITRSSVILQQVSKINKANQNRDVIVNKAMFISHEKGTPQENYELQKALGEGAYGTVIKAIHKLTKDVRAIKIIKKSGIDKESEITNEINMLTMMDHPNIVKIFEFYATKKEYYLVTELCQGGELFDKIISAAPLSEEVSANIMYQIFSAVHYCHSMGIIHRDLKPENILLTGTDNNTLLKIIDFGTAKIFDKNKAENKMIGSCYYMAPEVLTKNYNEKCDLWSCGVILYILLTGEPPFGGTTDDEIMNKILIGNYNMNKEHINKRSNEVKDLIRKLLLKNPSLRISAEEALIHPWMKKYDIKNKFNRIPEKKIKELLNNIKGYNPGFVLQQAALGFLVHNNPQLQDIVDASKLFNLIDSNNDGIIVKSELFEGLKLMLNLKENDTGSLKDDIDKVFKVLDSDDNGYLEYGEFVRAAINRKHFLNENYLQFAFNHFDTTKTGHINANRIKEVFGKYRDNVESEVFSKIIADVDLNGDGIISYREFETVMKNILK
jgi:calcium-dependent protein kinase